MAKYNKILTAALLGAFTLGAGACKDKPTGDTDSIQSDGDCDPALDGDPDCDPDGICNTDDLEDPDCTFCDYNPTDEDCRDWFEPGQVDVDGFYALDPSTGNAVAYMSDGNPIQPEVSIVIYDARYNDTSDPQFVCGLSLVPKSGTPAAVDWHSFKATLTGSEVSYRHYGMTLKSGEYDVLDNTLGGQVRGCLQVEADTGSTAAGFRPSVWGTDFAGLIGAQDWGVYQGDPSSEIAGYLTDSANDDPANDYDLYSLNQDGYILGGSQQASEYVGTQVFYYTFGFALDDGYAFIPTGNEDDPDQRLLGGDMLPVEEGETRPAARGLYIVRSALYIWNAKPLLLGTQ